VTAAPRLAILVDRVDWHARRLVAAFARHGIAAETVGFQDCALSSEEASGVRLPGFPDRLPAAVLVRCVPGGSFEQVTLRLGILHGLRALGVPVVNDARAIERCVDKSMTSFLFQRAGLPTPRTWALQSPDQARTLAAREARPDRPLVLKPLFGSQGRGLRLVRGPEELPEPETVAGLYYLQAFVGRLDAGWSDCRVLVAGGRALAAMRRHGSQWITNAYQGAHCARIALDPELASLALAGARAVGAAYAGVDIIHDPDGRAWLLEVNSMPAWSALQRVHDLDVTLALVDALLARELAALSPRAPAAVPLAASSLGA